MKDLFDHNSSDVVDVQRGDIAGQFFKPTDANLKSAELLAKGGLGGDIPADNNHRDSHETASKITRVRAFDDLSVMSYLVRHNLNEPPKNLEEIKSLDFLHELKVAGQKLKEKLINQQQFFLYEEIDKKNVSVLAEMENHGIKLDVEYLFALTNEFKQEILRLEQEIYKLAGVEFNIASPRQLGDVLFEKLNLPYTEKKTASGQYSTSHDLIADLAESGFVICEKVIEYRHLQKMVSTYTESLPASIDRKSGRIHTFFQHTKVNTGRISSINPNLQNIPIRSDLGAKIRRGFIPEKGWFFLGADYSQIELRVLAHIGEVTRLIEAFKQGYDIHQATASEIFSQSYDDVSEEMRQKAKAINFGIMYGLSSFGLAKRLKIEQSEAKIYIDGYFARYPELKEYMDRTIAFYKEHKYVTTMFNRVCYFEQKEFARGMVNNAVINAPIQGSAADIIRLAMNRVHYALKKEGLKAKMILQIHDEILLEVPQDEIKKVAVILVKEMENIIEMRVPMLVNVELGGNLGDMQAIKVDEL